jgi:tetratricopeptide (TPR) repeat protein
MRLPLLLLFAASLPLAAQDAPPKPKPVIPAATLGLADHIAWIKDGTDFFEGQDPVGIARVDRSALLDDACKKAKAEGKLVLWYVHRIIEKHLGGRQMYRAPVLDIYMQQVLFADPDVSELIAGSFVPVRAIMDQKLSDRFELHPLDFVEPAVVFLDGDGKIVHFVERFRTFSAHWFADLCVRVLDKSGLQRKGGTPQEQFGKGLWRQALAALAAQEPKTGETWLQMARLQRLLRLPEQALDSVAKAEAALVAKPGAPGEGRRRRARTNPAGDALCERGLLLTMTGKLVEAQPILEQAYRSGSDRAAEAGYLHAANSLRLGDEAPAMRRFQIVAQKFPDDWAGKKARANAMLGNDDRPFGAAFTGFETLHYLPDAAYSGLPRDTQWAGNPAQPTAMARTAVEFLLSQQRNDGGFTDARYAYWPDSEITPNVWVAITAIACTALLEYRPAFADLQPSIDAALLRGERFMFDPQNIAHERNEECYSDTYRLLYLSRKAGTTDEAGRQAIVKQMNDMVQATAAVQQKSGFFAHEYENAFASGAVLWGVLAAKSSGASVPPELTDKGAAALLSARQKNGAYVYGGAAPPPPADGKTGHETGLKDAAARMPVCEGTLFVLGRSDLDKVRFALENFWTHMKNIETVRRNDFHSDGELGGFFFFHAVFHASEVVKLLPEGERAAHWQKFVALLQKIPEMDGSFLDSHELGRSYGTAMALLTLKNATN